MQHTTRKAIIVFLTFTLVFGQFLFLPIKTPVQALATEAPNIKIVDTPDGTSDYEDSFTVNYTTDKAFVYFYKDGEYLSTSLSNVPISQQHTAGTYSGEYLDLSVGTHTFGVKACASANLNSACSDLKTVSYTVLGCSDSDKRAVNVEDRGKNYFQKGTTYGIYGRNISGGGSGHTTDYCSTGGTDTAGNPINLTEFYCMGAHEYTATGYYCVNGCVNGACVICTDNSLKGDLDGDGQVTQEDANIVVDMLFYETDIPENICCIDVNDNGKVDVGDLTYISNIYLGEQESPGYCGETVEHKPDLKITKVEITGQPKVGDKFIEGYVTIKNQGSAQAKFEKICNPGQLCTVKVLIAYLKGSSGSQVEIGLSGPGTGGYNGDIIEPSESKKYSFSTYQDESIYSREDFLGSTGSKTLYFVVDEENIVNESDENNNTLEKIITVTEAGSCTDTDGGLDFYNAGLATSVDSYGTVSKGIDNCITTVLPGFEYQLGYLSEYSCDGIRLKNTIYECPNGCKDGACIKDTTQEHDLVVKNITGYFTPVVGNPITFQFDFADLLDNNFDLANHDFDIDAPGGTLTPSKSNTSSLKNSWFVNIAFSEAGKHTVTATIDPYDKISEINENNNTKSYIITIEEEADTPQVTTHYVTDITSTSAKVVFKTDVLAKGTVWYKPHTDQDYDYYVEDSTFSQSHAVTLNNLSPNTLYYYMASAVSEDNISSGQVTGQFTTAGDDDEELKPDLIVKSVAFYKEWQGKPNVIVAKVCNQGSAKYTSDNLATSFTIAPDVISHTGSFTLMPGECSNPYVSVGEFGNITQSGSYMIKVLTSAVDDGVMESNHDNNYLDDTIYIKVAGITKDTPPDSETPKPKPSVRNRMAQRLAGRLLLAVHDKGRIYYVNPVNHLKYEVTFGNVMKLFQDLALGISNADLYQILVNPSSVSEDKDSDGDGYNDKSEAMNGYNPDVAAEDGTDKIHVNTALSNRLMGRLLLQVEDHGRIWYVDQAAKRWEVTWANVMNLFTSLALGITNSDLAEMEDGN